MLIPLVLRLAHSIIHGMRVVWLEIIWLITLVTTNSMLNIGLPVQSLIDLLWKFKEMVSLPVVLQDPKSI